MVNFDYGKNEILVYRRREVPYERNLGQKVFGRLIWPWKFVATNDPIKSAKFRENGFGGLLEKNLYGLAKNINDFYDENNLPKNGITLATFSQRHGGVLTPGSSQQGFSEIEARGLSLLQMNYLTERLRDSDFEIEKFIPEEYQISSTLI